MEFQLGTTELSRIVEVATEAALEVGTLLRESFGNIRTIEQKADRSLVTNVDKEAEAIIVNHVSRSFPHHRILAEERGRQGDGDGCLWVIDPLDGTHNFIRGISIFGVSIGVVHRDRFVAGVIYMPCDNDLYVAAQGKGAYKNGNPIHLSTVPSIEECSLSFDSTLRGHGDDRLKVLGQLGERVFNVRMFGCSTRVLTYLADGTIDAAVEFSDHPWDFAAGICLVQEAGGKIVDMSGGSMQLKDSGYVAANPVLHEKVFEAYRTVRDGLS